MNVNLLKARMVEHGYNDQSFSQAIGINVATFYRKKTGDSDFNREEIKKIKDLLHLTLEDVDRIFFGA